MRILERGLRRQRLAQLAQRRLGFPGGLQRESDHGAVRCPPRVLARQGGAPLERCARSRQVAEGAQRLGLQLERVGALRRALHGLGELGRALDVAEFACGVASGHGGGEALLRRQLREQRAPGVDLDLGPGLEAGCDPRELCVRVPGAGILLGRAPEQHDGALRIALLHQLGGLQPARGRLGPAQPPAAPDSACTHASVSPRVSCTLAAANQGAASAG